MQWISCVDSLIIHLVYINLKLIYYMEARKTISYNKTVVYSCELLCPELDV